MTAAYRPGRVPMPEERPVYATKAEKEAADKRAQRARQRERRIAAGLVNYRVRDGVKHPLDCCCYDCLYPAKI